MKKPLSLILIFLPCLLFAQNPKAVTLKQWMGVVGNENQEELGIYVLGIKPSTNLPYRAAVSRYDSILGGVTDFFRLQSPTDTTAQLTLRGLHPLVGDFDDDGFQDIAIVRQSSGYDTVCIYWGTATGIDTLNPLKIPAENRYDNLLPACVGDINNDGKTDLILSASQFPNSRSWGKVYIFINPITSSASNYTIIGDSLPLIDGQLKSMGMELGVNCTMGDLNNDGCNDLIVRGERGWSNDSVHYDFVNIYWGTGKNLLPDFAHPTEIRSYHPLGTPNLGLACFDANGDGIPDLIWATLDSVNQKISIHYGGKDFSSTPNMHLPNPGVNNYGWSIADGGDMNGHGYNDIVVGCPAATYTAGFVFVYSGGPKIDTAFDAALGVQGLYTACGFGESVSSAGDVNGDGLSDIIVGSPSYPMFGPFKDSQGFWGIFLGDSAIPTSVKRCPESLPGEFKLDQAYPNPFNPGTTINYQLSANSRVTIKVYDILGREIKTLIDEDKAPGEYEVKFDASGLASGVYYYRVTATTRDGKTFMQAKKVSLIK